MVTFDEFQKLTLTEMAEYINQICDRKGIRHYFKIEHGKVYDIVFDDNDPMTEIDSTDEMSALCHDYHTEPTDLQGQIFC